jgi:hypothetical protein
VLEERQTTRRDPPQRHLERDPGQVLVGNCADDDNGWFVDEQPLNERVRRRCHRTFTAR